MATVSESSQVQIDLKELVKEGTWKSLLIELVDTKRLDPWNIDIIEIVDSYIDIVRKLEISDLRVPANIILAASILLRMKSESLKIVTGGYGDMQDASVEIGSEVIKQIPDVPLLLSRSRLQPGRRVTLTELMDALNEAIKFVEKREVRIKTQSLPINILVQAKNIDQIIEATYNTITKSADNTGLARFSELSMQFDKKDNMLVNLFIPLLFLAHRSRITLIQESFFNEIFIKLVDVGLNGR